ncbi:hypothetical protein V2G26_009887 [Clonostachys chloroleuca]
MSWDHVREHGHRRIYTSAARFHHPAVSAIRLRQNTTNFSPNFPPSSFSFYQELHPENISRSLQSITRAVIAAGNSRNGSSFPPFFFPQAPSLLYVAPFPFAQPGLQHLDT